MKVLNFNNVPDTVWEDFEDFVRCFNQLDVSSRLKKLKETLPQYKHCPMRWTVLRTMTEFTLFVPDCINGAKENSYNTLYRYNGILFPHAVTNRRDYMKHIDRMILIYDNPKINLILKCEQQLQTILDIFKSVCYDLF